MPFHSFSRDAALILVDALLTLDVLLVLLDGGPIAWEVFSHASLYVDLMVFMTEEPDFINILGIEGTPGRVLVLGILSVLGPAERDQTFLLFCLLFCNVVSSTGSGPKKLIFCHIFLIPTLLQSGGVNLLYFKLRFFNLT